MVKGLKDAYTIAEFCALPDGMRHAFHKVYLHVRRGWRSIIGSS